MHLCGNNLRSNIFLNLARDMTFLSFSHLVAIKLSKIINAFESYPSNNNMSRKLIIYQVT